VQEDKVRNQIMKFYVIASIEYEANTPDLFLMDEEGRYYGVGSNSYVRWKDFPKSVEHWTKAEGSDAGRRFIVDEVEMPKEKAEEFNALTTEFDLAVFSHNLGRRIEAWKQRTELFITFSQKVYDAIKDNENIKGIERFK